MEFAKNLKRERENIGLSQAEFADRIGVAQPMVAQYEMGIKQPAFLTIVNIERVLGVSVRELVDGVERKDDLT